MPGFPDPSPLAHAVPVAPTTGRIPAALDRRLGALALAAQEGDAVARDAIYAALAPRLDVVVRMVYRRRSGFGADPAIELADLQQEAYLVLVDLVDRWTGEVTLCSHVLSRFHWRIHAAYTALGGGGTRGSADVTEIVGLESIEEAGEADASPLRLLTAGLPERQRAIVILRVVGGYRQWQVANALKIGRSTLTREWDRALATLRESLRVG
jgi:RNA polymerase sigma factor (sigma-70 family)